MGLEQQLADAIVTAFDELGGDPLAAIEAAMHHQTVEDWVNQEAAKIAVSGGAEMIVPGLHALTIPAGIAYLLRKMATISWGIGALHGAYVIETTYYSDLQNILTIWANNNYFSPNHLHHLSVPMDTFTHMLSPDGQKLLEKAVKQSVENKVDNVLLDTLYALQVLTDEFGQNAGAVDMVAAIAGESAATAAKVAASERVVGMGSRPAGHDTDKPMGRKISTRLAARLASRLASRLPAQFLVGFVPLAGAVFNALLNAQTLRSMAEAADIYYSNPLIIEVEKK